MYFLYRRPSILGLYLLFTSQMEQPGQSDNKGRCMCVPRGKGIAPSSKRESAIQCCDFYFFLGDRTKNFMVSYWFSVRTACLAPLGAKQATKPICVLLVEISVCRMSRTQCVSNSSSHSLSFWNKKHSATYFLPQSFCFLELYQVVFQNFFCFFPVIEVLSSRCFLS